MNEHVCVGPSAERAVHPETDIGTDTGAVALAAVGLCGHCGLGVGRSDSHRARYNWYWGNGTEVNFWLSGGSQEEVRRKCL